VFTTQAGMTNYVWSVSSGGTIVGNATTNSITVTWATTGSKSVSVGYTNGNGCSAVGVKMVTVYALPVPTISGPARVCAGTTGNVYTTESGKTAYDWDISAGGTITGGGGTSDYTVTVTWNTDGARSVSVNYTNSNGCDADNQVNYPVTVDPLPTASAGSSQTICSNGDALVSGTSYSNGNIAWSHNGGGSITGGTTITPTYHAAFVDQLLDHPITLTMTVTGLNTCSSHTATATYTVNIQGLPEATISGGTGVCKDGTSPHITFTGTYGTPPYTFTYKINTGSNQTISTTSGSSSVVLDAPTDIAGTFIYTLVGVRESTTGTQCYGNASGSTTVTVYSLPVPVITGPNSICEDDLAGKVYSTAAGMTNYIWSVSSGGHIDGGGGTSSNTVTVTWNGVGSHSVSVGYTDGHTCTSPVAAVYDVNVHPLPVPTINGPSMNCTSAGNVYTTESGMTNYVWAVSSAGTVTGGGGSSDNTVTVTWNSTGPQTISVGYTNANGCSAAGGTVFQVNTFPVPEITGPATACQSSAGNVYSTQSGMTNYSWTVPTGGTIVGPSNAYTVTVTWNTAGSHSVRVNYSSSNGCTANNPTIYNVTVEPLPAASAGGSQSICSNGTATVSGASAANGTILWTHNGTGSISGETGLTPTYTAATGDAGHTVTLTMTVSNTNTCSSHPAVAYYTVTVTALALPTASAGGSQSICPDGTATVGGASASNGTILWTENGAGSITSGETGLTPVYTPAPGDAGHAVTLTMTVTSTNNCGSSPAVATYTVNVNSLPTVTFDPIVVNCGATVTLASLGHPSGGTFTGSGVSAGVFYPDQVLSGSHTVTYTYTDPSTHCTNTASQTATVNNTMQAGLYETGCGKFAVKLKPCSNINGNLLTDIQFTIKWPANTVNIINPVSSYSLTQQGAVTQYNNYNYITYAVEPNTAINWLAGSENTVLTFQHDGTSSGTADFTLVSDTYTGQHGGSYYVEVDAVDVTDAAFYHQATNVSIAPCPAELKAKVLLQGAFDGTTGYMRTNLKSVTPFPANQPYNVTPWNYPGTETYTGISAGSADVVDWVLVEIRDANTTTVIDRRAGILMKNGDIKETDLATGLIFTHVPINNYYIAVQHRNHLAVMSGSRIAIPNLTTYDFSDTVTNNIYGKAKKAMIQLGGLGAGKYAMIAGDVNHDGMIVYSGSGNDRAPILTRLTALTGTPSISSFYPNIYLNEDVTMDGVLAYSGSGNDRAIILTNLTTLNNTTSIITTYSTRVPGALVYNHKGSGDGPVELIATEDTYNYYVSLKTTQAIDHGLIDNIQFTLSWDANDLLTERLISGYSSAFNLIPQGDASKIGGKKYLVFATADPKELPERFEANQLVLIMAIPKNGLNTVLLKSIDLAADANVERLRGDYYVSVWGEDMTGNIAANTTFIDENQKDNLIFSYYPNPTLNGKFTINVSSAFDQTLSMKIYDVVGTCVYDCRLDVNANTPFLKEVNLDKLSKGTYLIDVSNNKMKYSGKVIIF